MEKLFYKKWSAILTVAAILLVAVLLCMMLTYLTQKASLEPRLEKLEALIQQGGEDIRQNQELLEYLKTDEYVRRWAEDKGYISSDDVLFIQGSK